MEFENVLETPPPKKAQLGRVSIGPGSSGGARNFKGVLKIAVYNIKK